VTFNFKAPNAKKVELSAQFFNSTREALSNSENEKAMSYQFNINNSFRHETNRVFLCIHYAGFTGSRLGLPCGIIHRG
jgi:hypothetical protein